MSLPAAPYANKYYFGIGRRLMKRIYCLIIALLIVSLSASARLDAADDVQPSIIQPTEALASVTDVTEGAEIKINGYLMENYCLREENPKDVLEFTKMHPKNCLLLPICIKSGFLVVSSDGAAQYQLDDASADAVVSYLEGENSTTHIKAIIKKAGNKYHLVSIDNLG
jgi:hypothetical protein